MCSTPPPPDCICCVTHPCCGLLHRREARDLCTEHIAFPRHGSPPHRGGHALRPAGAAARSRRLTQSSEHDALGRRPPLWSHSGRVANQRSAGGTSDDDRVGDQEGVSSHFPPWPAGEVSERVSDGQSQPRGGNVRCSVAGCGVLWAPWGLDDTGLFGTFDLGLCHCLTGQHSAKLPLVSPVYSGCLVLTGGFSPHMTVTKAFSSAHFFLNRLLNIHFSSMKNGLGSIVLTHLLLDCLLLKHVVMFYLWSQSSALDYSTSITGFREPAELKSVMQFCNRWVTVYHKPWNTSFCSPRSHLQKIKVNLLKNKQQNIYGIHFPLYNIYFYTTCNTWPCKCEECSEVGVWCSPVLSQGKSVESCCRVPLESPVWILFR